MDSLSNNVTSTFEKCGKAKIGSSSFQRYFLSYNLQHSYFLMCQLFRNVNQDIPISVTMLYTVVPGILGGLLFAAPFLVTARSIPQNIILKNTWLLLHGDLFSSMLQLRLIYYMLLISIWLYYGFFSRIIDFPDIGGSILFCHLNFCRCKFAKTH